MGNRTKNKTKKKFRKLKCFNKTKKNTCYSSKTLNKFKELWNVRHPDNKIKSSNEREIWKSLKNNLSHVCHEEACWLKQKFVKNNVSSELKNYLFLPFAPKEWSTDINTWLTSVDIEKIMKQYEHEYPNFSFLGPSPIDFDTKKHKNECVWNEICKFKISNYMKKGKNKIGFIFNLDEHWKEGSHWVSMFIDVNKKYIFYFDSAGDDIPHEIKKLVYRIISEGKDNNIEFKYVTNYPMEHQYENTECGMYCLYMIILLLTTNKTYEHFKKNRVPDNEMEKLRFKYFNVDY